MSETQTVWHKNLGYSWGYSLEVENVVPVEGTRASAKTTEKFSVGGNVETFAEMLEQMRAAKSEVKKG
jgi:hypothetical protein